jgi:hypothetical protein
MVKSSGSTLFFAQNEVALVATAGAIKNETTEVIRQSFADANKKPVVEGINPLPGKANFLLGNDSSRWHQNLSTYGSVVYRSLYPGIDLQYFGSEGHLKREFMVAPGADPSAITLHYDGVTSVFIDENGSLGVCPSPALKFVQDPPGSGPVRIFPVRGLFARPDQPEHSVHHDTAPGAFPSRRPIISLNELAGYSIFERIPQE